MQGIRTCKAAILAAERGFVVLSITLCALNATAAHYYVAPGGTGDYTQANPGGDPNYCSRVHAVNSGDVIHLAAGTYVLGSTPAINGTVPNQQIFLKNGVKLIGATDDPADTKRGANGKYHGKLRPPDYDNPTNSIDHVLYTAGIHGLKHEIGTDQTALDATDHSPVLVEFELR